MKSVSNKDEIVSFDSQLILHDFGNLAFQVVRISDDVKSLKDESEALNQLFLKAGSDSQFQAEVQVETVPIYRWQWDGSQ